MRQCGIVLAIILSVLGGESWASKDSSARANADFCTSKSSRFIRHVEYLADYVEDENDNAYCVEVERRENLETQALNKVHHRVVDFGDFIEIDEGYRSSDIYFFSKPTSPAYPWAIKFSLIPMGEPQGLVENSTIGLPPNVPDDPDAVTAAADWLWHVREITTKQGYKDFFNIDAGPSERRTNHRNATAPRSPTPNPSR
jgi:hypothetical protein